MAYGLHSSMPMTRKNANKLPENTPEETSSHNLLDGLEMMERLIPELFSQATEVEKNLREEIGREVREFRVFVETLKG